MYKTLTRSQLHILNMRDKVGWIFLFFQQQGPFSVVYIHVISSLISSEAKLALWFYSITRRFTAWLRMLRQPRLCTALCCLPSAGSGPSDLRHRICRLRAGGVEIARRKGWGTITQLKTTVNEHPSPPFFILQPLKMQEICAFGGWMFCFVFFFRQTPRLYSLPY